MVNETAGDPITGLRWTHKTTTKVSAALQKMGIAVGPRTIARLLEKMNYALRVNHKKRSTVPCQQRNQQFEHIQAQRKTFQRQGWPILSVDTKKKEMIGCFKNPGKTWQKDPILVNDHDFKCNATGIAIPRGAYDVLANRGFVSVGVSHDTPVFAVEAIRQWWKEEGRRRYPQSRHLLLLADSGGSNAARSRVWKHRLQTELCNPCRLTVTVCHYPPGTSKWNPIEHRLFSEISKNWAGRPLQSYETMLNYLRTTKTKTGLSVRAACLDGHYPIGMRISKEEMGKLNLRFHTGLPQWNYTISPN
jgi:hypothetical protein